MTEYCIEDILPRDDAAKYWPIIRPKFGDGRVAGLVFEPVMASHLNLDHVNEKFVDFRSRTERRFPIEMKGRTATGIDFKASGSKGMDRTFDRDGWDEAAIERDWLIVDITRVVATNNLYFMLISGHDVFHLGPKLTKKQSAALFAEQHENARPIAVW